MKNSILNFADQLKWQPAVANDEKLTSHSRSVLIGMGGSRLAADLLRFGSPDVDLTIHSDYGLPRLPELALKQSLLVFCSYSGNTEEVLDGLDQALKAGLAVAVIAAGGKLLERARAESLPHVALPDWQLVPRLAIGLMLKALVALVNLPAVNQELEVLAGKLNPADLESQSQGLVQGLTGRLPIVYTSAANWPLAWIWKIKFNETAKMPAFANVLPEQNHNELEGFDNPEFNSPFSFLFLSDPADHPRIRRRFEMLKNIFEQKGLPVTVLELVGESKWEKFFNSLILSDWTTFSLAVAAGREAAPTPLIEDFKKLMVK